MDSTCAAGCNWNLPVPVVSTTLEGNAVNDSGAAVAGISGLKGRFCQPRSESAQPTEAWVIASNPRFRPEGPIRRSRS